MKRKKVMTLWWMLGISLFFPVLSWAEISFGSAKGNIILIEYLTYNCPVCRGYMPIIDKVVEQNRDLEVIQRVVPSSDAQLQVTDRAILASFLQHKFPVFQQAILNTSFPEAISPKIVFQLARFVHINVTQLIDDMGSPTVTRQIVENVQAYKKTGRTRLPVLIFYDKRIPDKKILMIGAQPLTKLQQTIDLLKSDTL